MEKKEYICWKQTASEWQKTLNKWESEYHIEVVSTCASCGDYLFMLIILTKK